jgi:hypothetical protein
MTDEQALVNRLREIEALFAGAAGSPTDAAAADTVTRILAKLREAEHLDPPREYRFTFNNRWSMQLFTALLRRYRIAPYRYRGQRWTTVMAHVTKRFVDTTLWPEFVELDKTLTLFLDEVTRRVIERAVCADTSDMEVRAEPPALPAPGQAAGANPDSPPTGRR